MNETVLLQEEDRTPLVEEVTPIGERAMSLADELGGLFGGGKMEDEKKEEQSLIQIEKVGGGCIELVCVGGLL